MSMFYGGVLEGEKLKNESKAESDIINEEEPYEVLHQVNCDIENQSPSISQVRRSRDVGDLGNCGGGMRDSLIGFKEGVPGVYSGFKLGHNRMRRRKSAPVILDENSIRNPTRPPRTHRPKSSSQLAVIYDTVYDKGGSLDFESDWLAQQKVADMDGQHVILETGESMTRVETGIRFYDPRTDSPTRPISTVVLPMSLDDDMSDSAESWGSDFDDEDVEEDEIYEVVGQPREKVGTVESDYEDVDVLMEKHEWKKPPLPPRHSIIFESLSDFSGSDDEKHVVVYIIQDMEKDTYIPVQMDSEQQLVQLPPLSQYAEDYQVKRYQIVKCIIENEKIYMKSLNRLIKEYEEPLLERKLISNDRVKVIFKHVHEILQCHQLFNMALSDRASEWETKEVIGDVIYASFSKSTVLKAYSSFISNFSMAMESIKETCKLVPAFLKFLKVSTNELSTCYNTIRKAKKFKSIKFNSIPINNRLYRHNTKQSLYDLMRQPLERIPQLVLLTQALVKVTPLLHPDRPPLQMALTHLECLSETLAEKRKDTMCKHKVRQLDGYCTGLDKPLASKKRYYIRHDDMLLCLVEDNKVVKTKLRRIIILNDLIICASILNKQKRLKLMTKKKYKVKWCIPIHDVNIIDVGSGISINIDKKTTTIKYSHSISSPRPGGKQSSQLIEDLQHDIALIGEIGGKVASLRRTYRFLDTKKVNNWFKDVKALLDRETEIANMNWIELSIPMRNQENERMRCLFNVHSPKKKLEWSAELENVKLRLAHNNNPGWFLQEENIYDGETAVLRRTLPLVSNMVPLFMIEQKYSVQCVLDVSDANMAHPMFWVFSGNEHVGLITLMEMNMTSEPHVVESFVACKARICCAELSHENADSNYKPKSLVWIGTMSGSILLFEPRSGEEEPFASANLKDSVITLKYSCGNMFAGMANGTLACFQRKVDGSWNLENPTIICLGVKSILTLTEAARRLWCACGSHIFVLDTQTLGIEKKIDTCEKGKNDVKHLVAYGIGVWSSSWKSSKLELYHAETLQQLQTINIATPVSRMKNEIDGRIQNINVDKIYVTALLAEKGLLWVGTNLGLIVTYPLPRLGGIPTVSGQACVSLHIHEGPVKHLHSFKVWKQLKKVEQDHEQNEVKSVLNVDMFSDSISEMETSMEVVQQNTSSEPMYFLVDPSAENQYGGTGSYEPSSDVLVHEVDERLAVDNDYLEEQIEEVKKSDNDAVNNDDVKNDGVNIGDNRNDDEKNDSVKNDGETPTSAKTTTTEGMTTNVVADVTEGEITDNKKEKVDTDSTKPSRRETYDSDDDITADQDFSFLEDEKNGYQFQSSKPGEDFSVYIEKDKAVVKSMLNTLPALKENGFVEMMEKFAGFSTNPLQSSTPSKPSDNVQSNIVDISCKKEGVISVPERDLSSNAPPASTETITTNGPVEADDAQTSETSGERRNEEEMNCSHGKTTDACEDCEEMKFQSDSGYELPFQLDPLPVTQPYAVINKMTDNGMENAVAGQTESESSSDIVDTNLQNPALESFYDQYKDLPLPKSPSNSVNLRNSSNPCASKTPVGSYTDKGIYTPLLISENLSTSLTSSIGLRAYEKEMSLNESSSVRETNESYYASLVSVSKREEETRSLLTPSYVVSVGMGHIDLRKKVRPMSGLDIFRSFSQDVCEPLLIIWKLS